MVGGIHGPAPWRPDVPYDAMRARRVERLRQAIEQGTYTPDTWRVASALIRKGVLGRELGGRAVDGGIRA